MESKNFVITLNFITNENQIIDIWIDYIDIANLITDEYYQMTLMLDDVVYNNVFVKENDLPLLEYYSEHGIEPSEWYIVHSQNAVLN